MVSVGLFPLSSWKSQVWMLGKVIVHLRRGIIQVHSTSHAERVTLWDFVQSLTMKISVSDAASGQTAINNTCRFKCEHNVPGLSWVVTFEHCLNQRQKMWHNQSIALLLHELWELHHKRFLWLWVTDLWIFVVSQTKSSWSLHLIFLSTAIFLPYSSPFSYLLVRSLFPNGLFWELMTTYE